MGEVLRRLDTEVLPANPKKKGWTPWAPLGLKGMWDTFMTDKMVLVVTKSNKVTNDILPRMQALWADKAARDAAKITNEDKAEVVDRKKREQRLIDTIDAFDAILKITPAWQLAF